MHQLSLRDFHRIYSVQAKSLFLSVATALYFLLGVYGHMHAPGPGSEASLFRVCRGQSVHIISQNLYDQGIIRSPFLFKIYLTIKRRDRALQRGSYLFEPRASAAFVSDSILGGFGISYMVTIHEGLTNQQVIETLNTFDFLEKDEFDSPPEGMLFPDTYKVEGGTPYSAFLGRMFHRMNEVLDDIWTKRDPNLYLKTPEEVLVLASIVEKETRVPSERALIAGVFINRLRKGMKIQSDPTTIYGLTNGNGKLDRPLLLKDLTHRSKHNTYWIPGLPPTPICNPSFAALQAAAHPAKTKYLFFVADGITGGHVFAEHYKDHLKNIEQMKKNRTALS